jgi:hypothetical protein
MFPLRFSKLWQFWRHRGKRGDERDTPLTIGSGRLPIEILQETFSNLGGWTLLRCCNVCRLLNQCIPGASPSLRMAMYLPASKRNTSPYKMAAISAFKFYFGVTLYGDFKDLDASHRSDHEISAQLQSESLTKVQYYTECIPSIRHDAITIPTV